MHGVIAIRSKLKPLVNAFFAVDLAPFAPGFTLPILQSKNPRKRSGVGGNGGAFDDGGAMSDDGSEASSISSAGNNHGGGGYHHHHTPTSSYGGPMKPRYTKN